MPSASAMIRRTVRHTGVMDRRLRLTEDKYEDALARAAAKRAGIPWFPAGELETGVTECTESPAPPPAAIEECVAASGSTGDIRFADIVSPHSPEEFFAAQAECPHPMLFRGARDRFEDLVTWRDLDRLICSGRRDASRIRVVMDAQDIPFPLYTAVPEGRAYPTSASALPNAIDPRKLVSFLRQGATLIVNGVERSLRRVADLADAFGTATQNRATVNLYASWQSIQGFNTHWDDHDVFAVQVRGEKTWRIYGVTRVSPLKVDLDANGPAPKTPVWTGRLTAGDVLHIPRGWWHAAQGDPERGGASIHLTCHVRPRTGADILAWLKERLTDHELFRRELPLMAGDGPWLEHVEAFRDLLESALRDSTAPQWARQLKNDFRVHWREHSGTRFGPSLEPWREGDWNGYSLRLRGFEHARLQHDAERDSARLTANGVTLELDPWCLPLIQPLAERSAVTVAELKAVDPDRFDGGFVDDFVKELVKSAVVAPVAPE